MRLAALASFAGVVLASVASQAAQFQCTVCPCTMPSNMSSTNTVEIVGGGAGGATASNTAGGQGGGGGGGGGYAKATNMTLAPSASINCHLGAGSAGASAAAGGDTVFDGTHTTVATCASPELCAQGGQAPTGTGNNTGGLGGSTSFGASTTHAGGAGGTTTSFDSSGSGGGGGGGPLGVGGAGGPNACNGGTCGGAGGGGANNGGVGTTQSAGSGGAGGANGTAIGSGGLGGTAPSPGPNTAGANGTADNTWGAGVGPAGGGGAGPSDSPGVTPQAAGAGGTCGGGGGGSAGNSNDTAWGTAGAGGNGCIVITYTPSTISPYLPGNGITESLLELLLPSAEAAAISRSVAFTNTTAGCRFTVSLPDGCTGAQANGTKTGLRLGDYQTVVDLAVDSGSGYTNGTYTWTSSGGGCTRAATGTVTVAGGALGGQINSNARGNTYTITDGGAGCTSRPTIAVPAGAGAGTGGVITANVFQLTPHNATATIGSTWSIPGVDYPVGLDTTLTLLDPSVAALPSGATWDPTHLSVTLAGTGGTLNGYDFSNSRAVEVTVPGWTITNNKFVCNPGIGPHFQSQIQVDASVTSGTTTIKYNYFDGGATVNVPCLTGGLTAGVSSSQEGGSIVFDYNYCINADSKCFNMNGLLASATVQVEEKYNLYLNFGMPNANSSHGEAEYSFCGGAGIGQTYTWNAQFNTAFSQYWAAPTNLTSQFAFAEADGCHHLNDTFHYNFGIAFGNQILTGSNNNNAQVSSANQFCGTQESGTASGQVMTNNLNYYSGAFFPYNPTGTTCSAVLTPADFNAGTGSACGLTSCN